MPKNKYLTWNDFEEFIEEAVQAVEKLEEPPTGVYGLPRGGLPISVTLSHRLNIPLLMAPTPGCLVVDDISDTGTTLEHYAKSEKYTLITWVVRSSWTKVIPYYYGIAVADDSWLVFPWEENTFVTPYKKEDQHAN